MEEMKAGNRFIQFHLRHFLALCLIGVASSCWPQGRADDSVTINLVNADVEAVVKLAAELTGRSFVVDPRVKGQVNVVSGQPISRDLVYPLLISALRMHGFAVVESNGITKIVPEAEARMHAPPTTPGRAARRGPVGKEPGTKTALSGDQLVTRIFPLRNSSASQLLPVLRPLMGANNAINAVVGSNALVVTDFAENVDRLSTIVETLDVVDSGEVAVIPIRYASAFDIAQQLSRIMEAGTPGAEGQSKVSIQSDYRTNSLLVRADGPMRLEKLRAIVERLDQSTDGGNIHIVPLRNADAVTLARTLRDVMSGNTASSEDALASPNTVGLTAGSAAAPTGQAVANPGISSQPLTSTQASFNGRQTASRSGSAGFIQADPSTNSLIVTAPDAVYKNLRRVIDQLDRRRAQVFIEALVVEVTSDRAAEFGIQWQGGTEDGRLSVVGGTNFSTGTRNIVGLAESIYQAKGTGTLSVPPGLNIGLYHAGAGLGALLRLLATDSRANILSAPNLLTLDNEEARIVIGQNVPFLTGQYAQTGSSVTPTPFQTIERRDVGITLRVKPQISEGGTVRLQLQQEASSVQETTQSGPITNKRSIESTVLVDDGMTIALGGLMEDSIVKGEDKVPGLGDVPIIGGLFRYQTSTRAKKNLMVFLRPSIVRNAADSQRLSDDRYGDLQARQQRFNDAETVEDGPRLDMPKQKLPGSAVPD
ncbi:MAG: type II secretion system secretin GspD [Rhizobium sp.]|nr:type II secretion system secretin GspD [Rhizobium sp.]